MRIMVFGTFDRLHPGHIYVLSEAQKRGDVTVVIARDHHVQHIKGRTPAQSETERLQAIAKRFPSLHVRLGDAENFLQPLREEKPDLIVMGYDQTFPPNVDEEDMPCPIERLPAFHPHLFKSSIASDSRR